MENPKIQFTLKGFSEVAGCRIFAFDGVAADRSRIAFTVKADLAMTRRYRIRLQELPLLCRAVLERGTEDLEQRTFIYTEQDMSSHADRAAAREEASKRKAPRRPASENLGAAWRAPQV